MAQPLEALTTVTFLGIRFWDPATDQQVSDGLQVVAWPETAIEMTTVASRTATGNYAFHGLAGMWELEHPLENEIPPASPPAPRPFLVQVRDLFGRFLPSRFRVELPLPYSGLFQTSVQRSPVDEPTARFYLFSAPGRNALPGLAAVRGYLTEAVSGRPAAYALLEIEIAGARWYGLCDERGCLAVLFPYPTFITQIGASPPGLPLAHQVWPMIVRAYYDQGLAGSLAEGAIPTLAQIRNQPQASLWASEPGPASVEFASNLVLAQETILRTGSRSSLWITPGA